MESILTPSGIVVANSSFQNTVQLIPNETCDLVIADWPFNKGIVDLETRFMIKDGVCEATRILKPNRTLVSVHYMEPNFHVWKAAEAEGLTFCDSITIPRHPMKKVKHRLAYESLSVLVFTKGSIEERVLNTACRTRSANYVFSKDIFGTTSDLWDETRFKNGYHRKNGDSVPEAMPESTVERILSFFCPRAGLVVDYFGGAGTIPYLCNKLGLRCISTEIQHHRYQIIQRRLYQTNQQLIALSKDLLSKALKTLETEPYTKGDVQWQEKAEKVKVNT